MNERLPSGQVLTVEDGNPALGVGAADACRTAAGATRAATTTTRAAATSTRTRAASEAGRAPARDTRAGAASGRVRIAACIGLPGAATRCDAASHPGNR